MFANPYPAVETGAVLIFLLACVAAARAGRQALVELLSAAVYGLLLEQGDILIFGTYKYSAGFSLVLYDVPVAIGLCWAVIIYGSMRITDRLGLPVGVAPAADALLALALDFSFDAVAIRQGMWQWNIGLHQAYFGVPAGNFYAWLFVAFGFSWLTRRVRARPGPRQAVEQALVCLGAYGGLLVALAPFVILRRFVFTHPGGGMPAVVFVVALFIALVARAWPRRQPAQAATLLPTVSRLVIHGYFLAAILALGVYRDAPVLLAVSLGLLAAELAITAAVHLREAAPALFAGLRPGTDEVAAG